MNGPDEVGQQGIINDVEYVSRLARDLSEHEDVSSIISLCIAPFYSLIITESLSKLKSIDPTLEATFSEDVAAIIAKSRNALKLFEDKKPKEASGISKNLGHFREKIIPGHAERFLGNTWLPPARFLETDLGLYRYGSRVIATTHAATFYMGFDPSKLLTRSGAEIQAIYQEYGQYFGKIGVQLDVSGPPTFVKHLSQDEISLHDVRADRYYDRVFNGVGTRDVIPALSAFQALMNLADTTLIAGVDVYHLDYTVFKIRYLILYAVLASLRLLHDDADYSLTAASKAAIRSIVDSSEALVITQESARPFRNTLMHYNLGWQIDSSKIDLTQPLFGMVPICFPSLDYRSFADLVNTCIRDTAAQLDEWAAAGR